MLVSIPHRFCTITVKTITPWPNSQKGIGVYPTNCDLVSFKQSRFFIAKLNKVAEMPRPQLENEKHNTIQSTT